MRTLLLLILLLPQFAFADLVCGKSTDTYYFEFLNHGQFQIPTAYMVDIYVKGSLWKQEEGLSYPTRGTTFDGYQFGIINTQVGPKQNYQVKIKSKQNKYVLVFVHENNEELMIPCVVRNEDHNYKPYNQIEKFSPLKDLGGERLPASNEDSSDIFQ